MATKKTKEPKIKIEEEVIKELDSRDKEIEDLIKTKDDLENKLKNALSDYQNFKRRIETEKENNADVLNNLLLRDFINMSDNLYLYIKHIEKTIKDENILMGINMIYEESLNVIKAQGVTLSSVKEGDTFSPLLHEVVGTVAGEDENKIREVVRVGYEKDGKVIRPARVIVEKKEN